MFAEGLPDQALLLRLRGEFVGNLLFDLVVIGEGADTPGRLEGRNDSVLGRRIRIVEFVGHLGDWDLCLHYSIFVAARLNKIGDHHGHLLWLFPVRPPDIEPLGHGESATLS